MGPDVSTTKARESRTQTVFARARALGFDAVGVADARAPLDRDMDRYDAFLDAGYDGEMTWLRDHRELRRRVDVDGILEGARSVVCVAQRYQRSADDEAADPDFAKMVARYARGRDYHNGLRKKLRSLARLLRTLEEGAAARPLTDDAPILERAWAARAGLGFVGKNGMLIVPGDGSFVLLGEVVTTVELDVGAPMAERCGSCRACLDACPTGAFPAPFVLDARRCVSYLTIELRSPIDDSLRRGVGEHLFGCDDCQTVCPFNKGARSALGRGLGRERGVADRYRPLDRWATTDLAALLSATDDAFRTLTEGSPLHRATREGLARNAAIVLGNRRDSASLGALRSAQASHPSAVVREAAAWAIACITSAAAPSNP